MEYYKFPCGCEWPIIGPPKIEGGLPLMDVDGENLPDCKIVWEMLGKGLTKGVFQLESSLGKTWTKKLKPTCKEHLSALNSILRPGCVGSNTFISIRLLDLKGRNISFNTFRIKDLYEKFHRNHFLYEKDIVSVDEQNYFLFGNKIDNVIYTGQKEVFKPKIKLRKRNIQTNNVQYNLECTADHKLLTHDRGWIELKDLQVGERIAVINKRRTKTNTKKNIGGQKYFREICYYNYQYHCIFCDWKEGSLDVNHLSGNRKNNNSPENLCFMCPNHHRLYSEGKITKEEAIKAREKYKIKNSPHIFWATYEGCESMGIQDTYDIKVDGPNHNFIAGGFIVHNCMNAKCEKGISMTEHYVRRKNQVEEVEKFGNQIDEILKNTYNIIIYQEQVTKIAVEICGFNSGQANALRKCVSGETMFVSKTRGWISINKLIETGYKNEEFLIMDENGKKQWKKIKEIWSTGKNNIARVKTKSGLFIDTTENHEFLTNNGWKKRKDLSFNDRILSCNQIDYDGKDLIDENLCIVIAGIITEGYFSERNSTFVNFDNFMMSTFIKSFKNCFNEDLKVKNNKVNITKKYRLLLSKYINYGLSDSRKIPEIMISTTKETMRKFLSFILAAEGGISKSSGQFEFSSKSFEMVNQVKLLLLRFGISSLILDKKVKGNTYYRLYINDVLYQKILLKELTILWPENKINSLKEIVKNKISNYSNDSFPSNIVNKMTKQYPKIKSRQGGSIYNKNITRTRFRSLAEKTNDEKWKSFSNGSQKYEFLKEIEDKGIIETFDFSMDDSQTPYIISNGIVIHNCIGKKNPEEMAKMKKIFLDGAKDKKIISEEFAIQLFDNIQKSSKYLFNRSHSMSYGLLGYDTAYLKAHFPLQFFTSWLYYAKDNADTLEEIAELIQEAKLMDIEVKVPDIRKMESEFENDGKYIYFGLTNIKGVGQSAINKLKTNIRIFEKELSKEVSQWSWEDFLVVASDSMSSTVMNNIISVGGFDWVKKSRNKLKNEYSAYSELTDKEKEKLKDIYLNNKTDFVSLLELSAKTKKDGGIASSAKRLEKINSLIFLLKNPPSSEKDSPNEIAWVEQRLLGVPITYNKTDAYTLEEVNTSCKDFISGKEGYLVLGVNIDNVRVIKTKTGKSAGQEMAFLTISDSSCSINEVVCFPENWKKFASLLSIGNVVLLQGERDNKNGSLIVKNVALAS